MTKYNLLGVSLLLLAVSANASDQLPEYLPPSIVNASFDSEPLLVHDAEQSAVETVSYIDALSSCSSDGWCGGDAGCGEGCGDCGAGCGHSWLKGLTFKSDHCFDGFIEPVSNPVYFEDPRSRTRIRMIFINQKIPTGSALGGGDFQVYAAQATVALNDRLSIIAQKDGFISLQADALPHSDGWADLATGLKYVLVRDVKNQFLVSTGAMVEWTNGSSAVFQGSGDGILHFFVTTGKAFGACNQNHFIGTAGWHLPLDNVAKSESLYYSLHLDRHLGKGLYGLVEMNGIQYVNSGNAIPGLAVEGGDLINLGSGNVSGNSFLSFAFGATQKVTSNLQMAAAWEFPMTGRQDLMDNRLTTTLSLIY